MAQLIGPISQEIGLVKCRGMDSLHPLEKVRQQVGRIRQLPLWKIRQCHQELEQTSKYQTPSFYKQQEDSSLT